MITAVSRSMVEEYLAKGFTVILEKRGNGYYRVRVVKTIGVVSEEEAGEIRRIIEEYKSPKTHESGYITYSDLPDRLRKILFLLKVKGYVELNDEYLTAGVNLKPFIILLKNPQASMDLSSAVSYHALKACGERDKDACTRVITAILNSYKHGEPFLLYSKLVEEAGIRE